MNFNTQNGRIEALTEEWLIVGVDVGSDKHFARAFTNRKVELSKKPFAFENNSDGFEAFNAWIAQFLKLYGLKHVMVGMEPTGHYWFNLAHYVKTHGMMLSHVNPAHVKKAKELDDSDPSKNDRKDPKVIGGLITDGRYVIPYIPEDIYAELRELNNLRYRETEQLTRQKNLYARWISIHFPELKNVYSDIEQSMSARLILTKAPLPEDVIKLGIDGINEIWRRNKIRSIGLKQARKLYEAAERSIGHSRCPKIARLEIQEILEDLDKYENRLEELTKMLEQAARKLPNADKLFDIPGVGVKTIIGFLAEVGDISRFEDAKAIQKLSGMAIVANQSGKHNGQSSISYRGRKHLRHVLYLGAISVIGRNEQFAEIYNYYLTRKNNPLKKLQAVIAIACKMIRVFYTILTKGVRYDGNKMIAGIKRPGEAVPAGALS